MYTHTQISFCDFYITVDIQKLWGGTSLGSPVVKTSPFSVDGEGLIPGWGAKIAYVSLSKNQTIQWKKYCNKFNKDLKRKQKPWGYEKQDIALHHTTTQNNTIQSNLA